MVKLSKQLQNLAVSEARKAVNQLPGGQFITAAAPMVYQAAQSALRGRRKAPRVAPRRSQVASAPVALAYSATSRMPNSTFHRVIEREEALKTITCANSSFDVQVLHIQPGRTDMFPWLAEQADGFQLYRFRSLEIFTVPMVGTSEPGRQILCPSYVESVSPATATDLGNGAGAQSNAIWASTSIKLDVKAMFPFGQYKTIADGASPDKKLSDAADVFIGFDGVASGKSISLRARYVIELFLPATSIPLSMINSHCIMELSTFQTTSATVFAMGSSVLTINPFNLPKHPTLNAWLPPKGVWEIEFNKVLTILSATGNGSYDFEARIAEAAVTDVAMTVRTGQQASWATWRMLDSINHATGGDSNVAGLFKLTYISDGTKYINLMYTSQGAVIIVNALSQILLSPLA
nr:structural protein [Tolivirales sp.]